MLYSVIVMLERAASVVRRVNEDALYFAGEFLLQRFEREQIVAKDEPVIEPVIVRDAVLGVIGFLRVFEQDARLQPGPVFLPDPRQFKFLFFGTHGHLTAESAEGSFGNHAAVSFWMPATKTPKLCERLPAGSRCGPMAREPAIF